jgi:uncharacterized membrane protein
MATHWGIDGTPDGYSSRAMGAWMMPLLMLAIWMLMRFLPSIDPRRANYQLFAGTYASLIAVIVAFMALIQVAILGSALGWPVSIARVVPIGVGALFVAIGVMLPKARSNWFFGIRTPWTLSSEAIWERTHKLGGVMFVVSGVLMAASAFGPRGMFVVTVALCVVLAAVVPIVYSLVLWLRERKQAR